MVQNFKIHSSYYPYLPGMDNIFKRASFIFMKTLLMVKMPKNYDLYLKRAARHMLRSIYQNAIRKDHLEFPNNAKPAQK